MNAPRRHYLAAGLSAVLLAGSLWCCAPAFGQTADDTNAATDTNTATDTNAAAVAAPASPTPTGTVADDLRDQIDNLNSSVAKKKSDLADLNKKVQQYNDMIMEKKAESATLQDQVALLDNRIAQQQLSIDIANDEIESLDLEISVLNKQMDEQQVHLADQKRLLGALARKLYTAQFKKSTLELLLSNGTFSDFFDELHSLAKLQTAVDIAVNNVKTLMQDLRDEKTDRQNKEQDSLARKRDLEVAQLDLEDQRTVKNELLAETQDSETQYRYLLADMKTEENKADSEITYLEKALRQKIDISDRLAGQDTVLSWPVVPSRGLSATFHDPNYPFRYIFEHPAIDIRAFQGTPVRAAAAGVVARAKDGGMGYSYVMLIHNNDLATVYGHLSKITAKEDTFVARGEVIGYSGGMPGTPGAGRLTTGPHLHFEVRLNGIPVDPMHYLVDFSDLTGHGG